jgi:YD repeat-containing protein
LHRMTSARDPRGATAQYTYASNGTLSATERPGGGTHTINAAFASQPTYAPNGRLLYNGNYTDDRGIVHNFTVNAAGAVERDVFTANGRTYDVRQELAASLQSPFGPNTTLLERENDILRVAFTSVNGLPVTPTAVFDDRGRPFRELVSTASVGSIGTPVGTFRAGYDAAGRISSMEPEDSNIVWLTDRNSSGRVSRVFDFQNSGSNGPTGRETLFTWRTDGQPQTITSHGITTTHAYRAGDGLLETASSSIEALSFGYDAAGNITSVNDGATTVSFSHDTSNRVTSVTDASGNVTTMGYAQPGCGCASQNKVTSIRTPDLAPAEQWTFDYDPDGRISAIHDPRGSMETFGYTNSGDLQQKTDRLSRSTSYTYDGLGRPLTIVDTSNRVGTFDYPIATATAWVGPSVFAASPSSSPAPTSMTATLADGQYQVGMNVHVPEGYPSQVEYYRDATFALSYGNRVDRYQRLTKREDRFGIALDSSQVFQVGANEAGPFHDESRTYNRDTTLALFRTSSANYPEESRFEPMNVEYNANFDFTLADGEFRPNVPRVRYVFGHDTAGRLTSLTPSVLGAPALGEIPPYTVTYLPNGQVNTTGSSAASQQFTYDARGLVDTMTLTFRPLAPQNTTLQTEGVFEFEYDEVARNTLLVYPDGHRRVQQWDQLGRLTSRCYEYPGVASTRCYTATYDAVGNPITLGDPERNCTAVYDNLDRLRSLTCSDGTSESYDYNALGALSVHAGAAVDHQRPRIGGGGLASAGVPANHGGQPVTLNGGGHVASLLGTTLTHSKRGRLISATPAGTVFNYDAFGRLYLRGIPTANGQQTELYGYDGLNIGSITRRVTMPSGPVGLAQGFVYEGLDQPLWMFDRERELTAYFELDTIGNVRRLRGGRSLGSGTVASDLGGYRYTAFGRLLPANSGTPAPQVGGQPLEQPLRWQARLFMAVAGGVYDFRSRIWSPELGAFLEADDFGMLTSAGTLWSWPEQNPLRYRDPYGEGPIEDLQSGLDFLAGIPVIGNLFAGPKAFGIGVQNRVEGTLKMSNEATFDEGDAQRRCGNAQIAIGLAASAAFATVAVGVAGVVSQGPRFISDPRKFPSISKAYWKGGSRGNHLHHWMIPKRMMVSKGGMIPDRFVNAGWNLFSIPGRLNSAMSPARYRNMSMSEFAFYRGVEEGIRFGIPAALVGSAYGGGKLGAWAADNWRR